jgi:hypothetical protein
VSRWGLRQQSAKRRQEVAERRAVLAIVWARDGGRCTAKEAVPAVRCWGPLDGHEVIPRSAWRKGWLEQDNVRLVCRGHHDWIDDHPDEAHAVGLHGYAHERTDGGR